jgi:hypothetical protein
MASGYHRKIKAGMENFISGGGKPKPSESQMTVARKCCTSRGLAFAIGMASGYHRKIKAGMKILFPGEVSQSHPNPK